MLFVDVTSVTYVEVTRQVDLDTDGEELTIVFVTWSVAVL